VSILHVKWWLIALSTVVAIAAPAQAQTFPSKTIRIIVPYPAGGSIDLTARVIARNLQDSVGQPVIVENKPGANAAIGIDALMRSDPDGHTLAILSDSPVTINVHLLRLNYDPLTDLVPISKVVSSPIIMSANAKAGIASIADLVAAAKAKPLSYAVAARGSSAHLVAELLQRELGLTMQAVPYRGGAPAAVAVASGEVPLALTDTAAILPMISSGQVVALGVAEPTSAPCRGLRCSRRAARPTTASPGSMPRSPRLRPCRTRKRSCPPRVSIPSPTVRPRCAASSRRTSGNGAN
jgi:tripartite-type tricarboxylate transporter receptor subunit TctC